MQRDLVECNGVMCIVYFITLFKTFRFSRCNTFVHQIRPFAEETEAILTTSNDNTVLAIRT